MRQGAVIVKLDLEMSAEERQAMFELQVELQALTTGRLPIITTDELIEIRGFLVSYQGDLRSLIAP